MCHAYLEGRTNPMIGKLPCVFVLINILLMIQKFPFENLRTVIDFIAVSSQKWIEVY